MLKKKQGLALLIAFLMLVSMIPGTTFAADTGAEYWVAVTGDDANPGTETAPFATIQAAIAASSAGDTIHVAAGEYIEAGQIVIDKDLSILGEDAATTIIRPDADYVNWILVNAPATDFALADVTLDGLGYNIRAAIRTYGSGSVTNCVIQNIRYSQYNGWGIALT
jgi:pectin methylesterase-like acyl-CoA thioesterase